MLEKQLSLFDTASHIGDSKKVSPTNTVGDTENQALQAFSIEKFLANVKVVDGQLELPIFDTPGAVLKDTATHIEDSKKVSPTNAVGDTENQALQRFLARAKVEEKAHTKATVKTYQPNGRKTEYFRLDYRIGKKVKSIHIPGGNIRAKLAQNRAKELQSMIDRGAEVEELIATVANYRGVKTSN